MTTQECAPIYNEEVNKRSSYRLRRGALMKQGQKEGVHEQMLRQAAAVLVSFPTLVALEIARI